MQWTGVDGVFLAEFVKAWCVVEIGLGEHVIDQDFGWDRTTVPDFSSNVAKTKESDAIWEPGVNIPGFEVSDHVGNKGILSYTQRILNTAMGNAAYSDKKILVLGSDIKPYYVGKQATPYFNWNL